MSLRELEYVVAVAEERSITRAAARLHMAQPALSQAIIRVERRLGVMLFERTSRRLAPTDAGVALAGDAVAVLAAARRAVVRARAIGGNEERLRVHVSEPSLLAPRKLVATIRSTVPDAAVHQTTLPHGEVVDQLRSGELSFAIGDRIDVEGVRTVRLGGEAVGVLMARSHELAARDRLGVDDLIGHPLVSIDAVMSRWDRYVEGLFEEIGATPTWGRSTVFGSSAGADALEDGRSLLVSLASIGDEIADHLVWRPLEPVQEVGWYLSWSGAVESSGAGRCALDAVLDRHRPEIVAAHERLEPATVRSVRAGGDDRRGRGV